MLPIGPMMIEHRLIERMVGVLKGELGAIKERDRANAALIDAAVDFFRTYADRTHHGKEEDILFRDLAQKQLSEEHSRIMRELVEEHVYARSQVRALAEGKQRYVQGDDAALHDIAANLTILAEFYPKHIEKEDKRFFIPIMGYFSAEERDRMLAEFWEFDRNMIHEKYKKLVEQFQGK